MEYLYELLGLTPHEINEFTQSEIECMVNGANKRREYQMEHDLRIGRWTAWHVARYSDTRYELPDLNVLLHESLYESKNEPSIALTDEQLYEQSKAWVQSCIKSGMGVDQALKDKYSITD